MSQGQAALVVLAFGFAVALTVGLCIVGLAIRYEIADRRRRRARGGMVDLPPAPIASLEMHRRFRANTSDRRPAA